MNDNTQLSKRGLKPKKIESLFLNDKPAINRKDVSPKFMMNRHQEHRSIIKHDTHIEGLKMMVDHHHDELHD